MNKTVRVRYAPSPTGEPHVGNIRTALFNWLFARHSGGTFVVRVEDTDVRRQVEGATEAMLNALHWLGLEWDEGPEIGGPFGPYFQSERLPFYKQASDRLIEQGNAYYCYCSPEELEIARREQQRLKLPLGYDRRCRDLTEDQNSDHRRQGITPVIRFRTPLEGETISYDYIRGEVRFDNQLLDDFIILKSDGYPTYHLANVVDDHLMEISHVLRAEEWLPSTPRHWRLYNALGYDRPVFVHLPMILGPDRSKLSKRHGATSALAYRDIGYLPEAMLNFLSLLGWSLDDSAELFSGEDLVRHFTLERIGQSPAIFDQQKLEWMNGVYIRQLAHKELADRLIPFLASSLGTDDLRSDQRQYLLRIVPLIQERIKHLAEGPDLISLFFNDSLEYDAAQLVPSGFTAETTRNILELSLKLLDELEPFDADGLENLLRPLAEQLEVKTGQLFGMLRVATTGRKAAPPLFQTMEVLGKERCLQRVQRSCDFLASIGEDG